MITKDLSDILKSAQSPASLSGLSMICADSSGNICNVPLSKVMIRRGSVSDLNEAKELGLYTPTATALNLPGDISTNTSDTIMNVGNTPDYFEQIYVPLLANVILKRVFKGPSGWSGWVKYSPS